VVILERLPPEYQDWYLLVAPGSAGLHDLLNLRVETYQLVRAGSGWLALANVLGSVLAGFVAVLLGVLSANVVFPRP